jgi:hypothetical protein
MRRGCDAPLSEGPPVALHVLAMTAAYGSVSGPATGSSRPTVVAVSFSSRAPAVASVRDVSWNPHVVCRATLTMLATVLGSQQSALGGATFNGGGFKPGFPNKRSTTPPCWVSGVPTLVELSRVMFVGTCAKIQVDGDWTCDVTDPSRTGKVPVDLNFIHIEVDGNFIAKGWGPPIPPLNTLVDIQGFVYWDPNHVTTAWHHHSGWELHSLTAWRLAH